MAGFEVLQGLLTEIERDARARSNTTPARKALDAYRACLKPLLKPYTCDGFLEGEGLVDRFFAETATAHLAVSLILYSRNLRGHSRAARAWEIHPEAQFYSSWYAIPSDTSSTIQAWTAALPDDEALRQAFAFVASSPLTELRRRALGEFFTPEVVANHLLSLTEYDPCKISGGRVIDPACGSGNLLAQVAHSIADAVALGSLDPTTAIADMNKNIHGYDIQPIAVLLTKVRLLLSALPMLERVGGVDSDPFSALAFPGIQLRDALDDPLGTWDLFAPFETVVGNPPFRKVAKTQLPFLKDYEDVLSGQPNLYQLFLWWAVRATKAGGRIAFLVPQSMKSGQYLGKLRQMVADRCEMTAITYFEERAGVFDSVDQPMMIVALRKRHADSRESNVTVRALGNGQSPRDSEPLTMPSHEVSRCETGTPIWYVSSNAADYGILAKTSEGYDVLGDLENFRVLNGGFVWNQHKSILRTHAESENTLPLISSSSIGVHRFVFPPRDNRVAQRLFADRTHPQPAPVYEDVAILIKRTAPKRMRGRRSAAVVLPQEFLATYPAYFAENHVNLVFATSRDTANCDLLGLCAWLNCKLTSFVFSMVNGSSHLSKSELKIIPVPLSLLPELGEIALRATRDVSKQNEVLEEIDIRTFDFFNLSLPETNRVREVVR